MIRSRQIREPSVAAVGIHAERRNYIRSIHRTTHGTGRHSESGGFVRRARRL